MELGTRLDIVSCRTQGSTRRDTEEWVVRFVFRRLIYILSDVWLGWIRIYGWMVSNVLVVVWLWEITMGKVTRESGLSGASVPLSQRYS